MVQLAATTTSSMVERVTQETIFHSTRLPILLDGKQFNFLWTIALTGYPPMVGILPSLTSQLMALRARFELVQVDLEMLRNADCIPTQSVLVFGPLMVRTQPLITVAIKVAT